MAYEVTAGLELLSLSLNRDQVEDLCSLQVWGHYLVANATDEPMRWEHVAQMRELGWVQKSDIYDPELPWICMIPRCSSPWT